MMCLVSNEKMGLSLYMCEPVVGGKYIVSDNIIGVVFGTTLGLGPSRR